MSEKEKDLLEGLEAEVADEVISIIEKIKEKYSNSPKEKEKLLYSLKKVNRFVEVELKEENEKNENKEYIPEIVPFEVVHVDFTGVGFEWDGPHYGIVWEVNPLFDSVTIIPTTSKNREAHVDVIKIGQLSNFNKKQTTLLVSDMTKVSRKKIEKVEYEHPKKGKIDLKIPKVWEGQILNAIAVKYMKFPTFQQYLAEKCSVAMIDDLKFLKEHRFKAIKGKYNLTTKELNFCYWDGQNEQTLTLKMPKEGKITSTKIKEEMINKLFSEKQKDVEEAYDYFEEYYDIKK